MNSPLTETIRKTSWIKRHGPDLIFYIGIAALALLVGVAYTAEAVPAAVADEVITNPDAALDANKQQAAGMLQTWLTSPLGSWLLAGALTAAAVARRVAPGLWGWGADIAYKLLATYKTRREDEKAYTLASWSTKAIEVMEAMPNEGRIGEFKDKMKSVVTPKMEEALQDTVAHYKTERNAKK